MSLFELQDVTKRFGGLVAANRVTFGVSEREIVGLIGPNGAGKTTIFNLIAGSIPVDSGTIRYRGQNIVGLKPHDVCRLGIARTFQHARVFRELSVLDNVAVGALCRCRAVRDAQLRAEEVLEVVGLSHKRGEPARSLTVGEQRRLQLATALATKPVVLLLDEVMAGLTPKEVQDTLVLLGRLRNDGLAMIVVEHVMQAVMTLSDRVVVMNQGEVIAQGAPRDVAGDPRVIEAYLGEGYSFA